MPDIAFPNESADYRRARAELLQAEAELRNQTERVAAMRRQLPPGGVLKEDYVFDQDDASGAVTQIKFSQLFAPGKDVLFLYGFMFGPNVEAPCPLCTSIIDAFNGSVAHVTQRINFAVVARSPMERIRKFARARGWDRVKLLSSVNNTYQRDYLAEDPDGNQLPIGNVFVRDGDEIRHFWGSELFYGPGMEGGDARHMDIMWPLWNVLDATPAGRGDFYPSLKY